MYRKWILFFFLSFSCLHGASHSLIFVHLGKQIPNCLFTAIKQARYLNPETEIYLLTDTSSHPLFEENALSFFNEERVILVDPDLIPMTAEHRTFHAVCPIDTNLSGGLWFYALERFFILFDFLEAHPLENVVHLENDTMLYCDLNELIPLLRRCGLAAPFQSLAGCIPCFFFIQNRETLAPLINHILSELKSYQGTRPHLYANDMQLLARFYRAFGEEKITPLPTLMPEYRRYFPKRKSLFLPDNRTPLRFLSMHASLFPGYLFDAAGLGIFLNGNDRRTSPGHGPGTIHSRCLFDPSCFSFFWGKDIQGHTVPYLSFKGETYRIVNLHFHSKMPEDYTSFTRRSEMSETLPIR